MSLTLLHPTDCQLIKARVVAASRSSNSLHGGNRLNKVYSGGTWISEKFSNEIPVPLFSFQAANRYWYWES